MRRQYRQELDDLRLTQESKAALVQALTEKHMGPVQRRSRRWRRTVVTAVAAVCALMVTAGAVVVVPPVLERYYGNSAGYQQASIQVGQSITKDGWTMTLTDCIADDYNISAGFELTAPEGTDLNWYRGYNWGNYGAKLLGQEDAGSAGWYRWIEEEETQDDGTIRFVLYTSFYPDADDTELDGSQVEFSFGGLYHSDWVDGERQDYMDCEATWTFHTDISLTDDIIRLEPNVPVTTLGVEATITSVTVSPIGVYIRVEGDELIGHHSWVERNAPDGWYGCVEYQEVSLGTKDGAEISLMQGLSGSGCSGGNKDYPEEGYLQLNRRPDAYELIDMDSLDYITICGVEIPLS